MMRNTHILAVDDEPFNLQLIEACFIDVENITISNAENGYDALEILETNTKAIHE
jgi:CheY-like chemotaxis protein